MPHAHDNSSRMPALPRRTLMAGAAWSVPVVAAAGAAPAYATSICSTLYDYNLAWGSASAPYTTVTPGVATYARLTSVQPGGDTIYVHFNTVATAANAIDTTRNLTLSDAGNGTTQDPTVTNLGATGQRGIRLQHNNVRQSGLGTADVNAQTLRVSFRSGTSASSPLVYVRNVSFYITDIDALANGGNNYSDRVSLLPSPTTAEQVRDTNVTANVSGGGTALVTVSGTGTDTDPWRLVNGGTNTTSNNNISETSAGTRVRVTYENTSARVMRELTLKYWSGVTTTIYHRVYLTNFTFKARRLYCG